MDNLSEILNCKYSIKMVDYSYKELIIMLFDMYYYV